jgi:23S rRNA pseudouridine2605 synthase
MKERLQKILSRAGIASRRAAENLILEGRVSVDGVVVTKLGVSVDGSKQDVRVDGARVRAGGRRVYIALHKPRGYVTTKSDPSRRPTVMKLLPQRYQHLNPVGRLDMATSGLLLLTNDGDLAQKLAHPKYEVPKAYVATVLGAPTERVLERAVRGVTVDGERLALDEVRILGMKQKGARDKDKTLTRLRVVLRKGKNREIRRVLGALGHNVVELHREGIGPLSVKGLPPGAFRPLRASELTRLRQTTERASRETRRPPRSRAFRKSASKLGSGPGSRPPRKTSSRARTRARRKKGRGGRGRG